MAVTDDAPAARARTPAPDIRSRPVGTARAPAGGRAVPVVATRLAYGGDAPTRLDRDVPHVFVLVPVTGEVLVDGSLRATSRTPAVLDPTEPAGGDAPTLLRYPDTTAMAFRIDRQAIETELASLLYEPVGEPPRFERSMDTSQPAINGRIRLAMIVSELRQWERIAKNPVIATDMERILIRGLLVSQPNTYSPRLTATPVPPVVSPAIAVMETDATAAYTTATLAGRASVPVLCRPRSANTWERPRCSTCARCGSAAPTKTFWPASTATGPRFGHRQPVGVHRSGPVRPGLSVPVRRIAVPDASRPPTASVRARQETRA